eukprot:5539031-Prorocentrum_lima.AAC.1
MNCHILGKVLVLRCDGSHQRAHRRGEICKTTESYPYKLARRIHYLFAQSCNSRVSNPSASAAAAIEVKGGACCARSTAFFAVRCANEDANLLDS